MFLNTYTLQYQLQGGFHGNEYDIQITGAPVKMDTAGLSGGTDTVLNILCKTVNLPGRNIAPREVHHNGQRYQVQGISENSGTIELTFYNDKSLNIREFFEKWINYISEHNQDKSFNRDIADYNAKLVVKPKVKKNILGAVTGDESLTYECIHIFPTNVSDLTLDGTNVTELTETTVTLAYSYITFNNSTTRFGF